MQMTMVYLTSPFNCCYTTTRNAEVVVWRLQQWIHTGEHMHWPWKSLT